MEKRQASSGIDAIEQIYRERYRRFLRVALAITGERALAEECVQEAFARAIRSRFAFRGDGSLDAWVWSIVLNEARSCARRRRAEPADEPPTHSNGHDPHEWGELRVAVAALPERQRLVVFLRHYADLRYEQIGEILQIERGTVAATLHAAHRALRRQVSEVPR